MQRKLNRNLTTNKSKIDMEEIKIRKTTYLIPIDLIKQLRDQTDIIKQFTLTKKERVSKSTAKHYSYKEDKMLHLIGYLYKRTNNLYEDKKHYNGIPQEILTDIIGFSSRKQTRFYLELLIELEIIIKSGKAIKNRSSYEYSILNMDLFTYNYKNKSLFTKMTFEVKIKKNKPKNLNTLLNKTITERVTIDTKSKEYLDIKEKLILENPNREITINYNEILLHDRNYNFDSNNTNNRRSSIFTQISKEFRTIITIDGEEVVSPDLNNSQPSWIGNFIRHNVENKTKDQKLFIELVGSSKFYEYLTKQLNIVKEKNKDNTKFWLIKKFKNKEIKIKDAKDIWMKGAYGTESITTRGDEVIRHNNYGLFLRELFPSVIEILDDFKISEYNNCANKLSIWESKFINDFSDFLFENGIINITIYDQFIIKKSDYKKFKELFLSEIKRLDLILNLDGIDNDTEELNEELNRGTITEPKIVSNTNTSVDIEEAQTEPKTIDMEEWEAFITDRIVNKYEISYLILKSKENLPKYNLFIRDTYKNLGKENLNKEIIINKLKEYLNN